MAAISHLHNDELLHIMSLPTPLQNLLQNVNHKSDIMKLTQIQDTYLLQSYTLRVASLYSTSLQAVGFLVAVVSAGLDGINVGKATFANLLDYFIVVGVDPDFLAFQ